MTSSNGNGTTLTAVRPDIFQIFLQDEDGQNILGIDDGALRQSLRIEIVNTSGQNIEFRSVDNQPSLNNYHFCISFRPGTLLLSQDEDKRISLKETDEGWQMQQQDNTFYLLLNSSESRVIKNGERITLTLENIGAAASGGSRGTRVEIKYDRLQYQGSNETISGNRLQYLNIVNQRGKKQIPLYVGFLGSNTILNDGTENELTLTIQSLPSMSVPFVSLSTEEVSDVLENSNITRAGSRPESFSVISLKEIQQGKILPTEEQIADSIIVKPDDSKRTEGILKLRGAHEGTLDEATKFTISFDVVSTESNAPQDWALLNSNDADDVRISVESNQEHWGFGGKETQGISPQWSYICQKGWQASGREELLRLKITNLKTLLKAGYANLYVHFENIPGYWDGYITVPIHKGPLVYREKTSGNNQVGCVGIGTDKPQAKLHIKPPSGVDGLKVDGNTAIAGNLSVTNGRLGIGSSNLSKEPLVIRAQGTQEGLIAFEDPNGNKKWHIEQNSGGNTPGLNFVETGVKDFRLFIKKGGNVGIGTSNPQAKLDVNGNTKIAGDLQVDGTLAFTEKPIIFKRYTNLGDSVTRNTGYSASDYSAAIVGFRALSGDIQENDSGNIIQVYMFVNNNKWWIRADFRTHKNSENWWVDVMFISNKLAKREGY